MRIVTLLFGSVLALLLGGCMLPRPWLAPLPTDVCPVEPLTGTEQILIVSFRVPDCREPGLKWTAFRSNRAQYAAADETRRTRLADEGKWKAELDRRVAQTKLAPIIYIHGYFNGQDD